MKWVTREKVHVDRVACPWLIKNFVDKDAEFIFVPGDTDPATIKDGTPFDMKGVELGHHGPDCSFDAIMKKYRLNDPALLEIQKIVHDADANAGKSLIMGAALRVVAEGYGLMCKGDYEVLEKEFVFYDAVYAFYRNQVGCTSPSSDCANCQDKICGK
jgi:hypothetical protein